MNKRFLSLTFTCLFLSWAILLHGVMIAVSPNSPATTICVDPPTSVATVGQNFTIHINISDVTDLYGWEFRLRWNPTVLDVVDVTEGPFLKGGGNTFFAYKPNNVEGYVLVDCTLLGNVPGVNGSGILANVKFYAEKQGESILDLCDTTLVDSKEQSIPHQPVDGYGYFVLPHDVAVISVTASPTVAFSGQLININVTVQNQGGSEESFNVTAYYNSNIIGTQPVSLGSRTSKILNFTWNTTGIGKGDYTISAEASVVPEETDIIDNTKVDGTVTIIIPGHDVAIKSVTPSKTIVGKGYSLSINVTAKNYGSFTETFNITVYYNETNPLATRNFITLTSGSFITITFPWDTGGYAMGVYTIKATATPVLGETNMTDNTYIDGTVQIATPGDINGDGHVDISDLSLLASNWFGIPTYDPEADINTDGFINLSDLSILATNWYKGPLD